MKLEALIGVQETLILGKKEEMHLMKVSEGEGD